MAYRIKSITELKKLASDEGIEVAILLMGGSATSTKFVDYDTTMKKWHIDNYIDSSVTSRLSDTNIRKAIAGGALLVEG